MQFFMRFYAGKLEQQICHSFTLLISYMVFNPFEMTVQFYFSEFDGLNAFSQIQQASGPDFRKVGISLILLASS